jgi:hypothetical protein
MFYLISFMIILVFIFETFKSIKLFDFYNETFKNTKKKSNNLKNKYNYKRFNNYNNIENFNSNDLNVIPQLTRHGFFPSNIGSFSNFQLNPNKTTIQELQEKYESGLYKYAPSYENNMVYNEDYFNPVKETYVKNRSYLPKDWKCQREWFDCAQDEIYFNKYK